MRRQRPVAKKEAHGGKNLLNGGGSFDKRDKAEVAFAICAFQFYVESTAQKLVPRDVLGLAFHGWRVVCRRFFILCVGRQWRRGGVCSNGDDAGT